MSKEFDVNLSENCSDCKHYYCLGTGCSRLENGTWDVPSFIPFYKLIWRYYHLDESSSCLRYFTLLFRTLAASRPAERSGDWTLLPTSSGEQMLLKNWFLKGWFHKQGFRGFKGEKGEPGLPGLDGLDAPCPVVWCHSFPFHLTACSQICGKLFLLLIDQNRLVSMLLEQTFFKLKSGKLCFAENKMVSLDHKKLLTITEIC